MSWMLAAEHRRQTADDLAPELQELIAAPVSDSCCSTREQRSCRRASCRRLWTVRGNDLTAWSSIRGVGTGARGGKTDRPPPQEAAPIGGSQPAALGVESGL